MKQDKKFRVGILGATGMVGQRYLQLLESHPWFEVHYLAASPNSAGKSYKDAVGNRWQMDTPVSEVYAGITVGDVNNIELAKGCDFVFSCFEMSDKEAIQKLEEGYARAGFPVVSSSSAQRWAADVPMLIPEINPGHLEIISSQQKHHKWDKGFIVVKPNCSLQSYLLPIYALMQAGFEVKKLIITTMQALSGAGYPGVPSLDAADNIVPYISGEEEKTQKEPLKILGKVKDGRFVDLTGLDISAHCNRVPVTDGHTACVSVLFGEKKPSPEQTLDIWKSFRSVPQELKLPSAPMQPIIYRPEDNRPQPKKDRNNDQGMAVTVGRLRLCEVFDLKFVGLSHNTIRGAAGGGVLNAELLVAQGYIK